MNQQATGRAEPGDDGIRALFKAQLYRTHVRVSWVYRLLLDPFAARYLSIYLYPTTGLHITFSTTDSFRLST